MIRDCRLTNYIETKIIIVKIPKTNRECYAFARRNVELRGKGYIIEKGTLELNFTLAFWICNNWLYPQNSEETEALLKTFSEKPVLILDSDGRTKPLFE